ncbi:MAG: stage II sporulation protein M [Candidatus Kapaibacterium sp.]
MKESLFVKRNADRWREFELMLEQRNRDRNPDKLATLFVQLTDDLSYARTFYPGTKTTAYLNSLTTKAHQAIYKRKRERGERFKEFWMQEIPLVIYSARKELLLAFIVFVVAILIGIVSTANDPSFPNSILGNAYVDMTMDNIANGDPMEVYKSDSQINMFLHITWNNIKVSFAAFVLGAFFSFGTIMVLVQNGLMIGVFHTFLHEQGALLASLLAVYIHGTIEISSIVVAGAAGLVMGNSLLFPGTFSRKVAFVKGAIRGLKIVIGLVPFFIVAGFLESFVTRYTNMPLVVNLGIIGLSLALIIGYFVVWPWVVAKRVGESV